MATSSPRLDHPHVTRVPGRCGGRPVIRGTRFPVSSVVSYVLHQGITPEELVEEFPHLTLAQVYDALSYYYDHLDQIDAEIAAEKDLLSPLRNPEPRTR